MTEYQIPKITYWYCLACDKEVHKLHRPWHYVTGYPTKDWIGKEPFAKPEGIRTILRSIKASTKSGFRTWKRFEK